MIISTAGLNHDFIFQLFGVDIVTVSPELIGFFTGNITVIWAISLAGLFGHYVLLPKLTCPIHMREAALGIITLTGARIARALESMTVVAVYAFVAIAERRESPTDLSCRTDPNMCITADRVRTVASDKM